MKLTRKDYITILKFYKIEISEDTKLNVIREKAERILAGKLCRCIKKVTVPNPDKSRAIAICQNSVLTKKKLKIHRFTCKKKPHFLPKKGSKTRINKIR
jgi:hypothetical protein